MADNTNYGRPVRKSPLLHGRKSTPTPKFLGVAKAYFICHIGPNFFSLIYVLIGCFYTVDQETTFWNMNSSVWAVWAVWAELAVRKK